VKRPERISESLNHALHDLLAEEPALYVVGEDIADPYGGAFRVTKGLSTAYPERVLSAPISESGFLGVAGGLAFCGDPVIVEVMFGDFIALGFDQILNFASKSVTMYGQRHPMRLVIRCPVGGNRGYGPTHSQSLQKHFIGIPNLSLFELSPFHDPTWLLHRALGSGEPVVLFEPKVLYGERCYRDGVVDSELRSEQVGIDQNWVRIFRPGAVGPVHLLISPGGTANAALEAGRQLARTHEMDVQVLVPAQLYPIDLGPVEALMRAAESISVAEESTAGGTWGTDIACHIYDKLWGDLRHPVRLLSSSDSVIPAAPHLERQVLLQAAVIADRLAPVPTSGAREGARRPGPAHVLAATAEGMRAWELKVTKLNSNDDSYVLLSWLAEEGAIIEAGQSVAEIETSKAVQDLTADHAGMLHQIVREDEDFAPGDVIGMIVPSGTLAREQTARAASMPPALADSQDMPLSRAQQQVAAVVSAAHREIPDAFAVIRIDLTVVDGIRRELDESGELDIDLMDLMVKSIGELHARFPTMFATFDGERIRLAPHADVAVTLDAGRGLFVPVVRAAERAGISEIADTLAEFRMKALRGTFSEPELADASIALSWNAEPGVVLVQPIIPPGLTGIIAAGGTLTELRLDGAGVVEARYMHMGMVHDHRVINGRDTVAFLQELKAILEDRQRLAELFKT
jgi:pyruvate/2-oxoglutarate/acetoin dehydrogenase E1 component/pyruvate/2-oxoglutarate dehydrogenase complex dihydrolipoamide acyltransferase (E2) component